MEVNSLVIIVFLIVLISCKEKAEYDSLFIIHNAFDSSPSVELQIQINDKIVYQGHVEKFTIPDKYSIYEHSFNEGLNKIRVSLPVLEVWDETQLDINDVSAFGVTLYHQPVDNLDILRADSSSYGPFIRIKKYKTTDLDQYRSLDYALLSSTDVSL